MNDITESLEEIKDIGIKNKIKPYKNYFLFSDEQKNSLKHIGTIFTNSMIIINEANKLGLKSDLMYQVKRELVESFDIMQARPDIAIHMTGSPISPIESN